MEFSALSNLIIGLVILFLAAGVYVGFQIKTLAAEIQIAAYKLCFELTRKDDLLPQFVEKLGQYLGRESFDELIKERAECLANEKIGLGKKVQEEKLWGTFEGLWQSAKAKPEVQKDAALMGLVKSLGEADGRIAEFTGAYNSLVKKYNGLAGNLLLKPVSLVVKAGKAEVY